MQCTTPFAAALLSQALNRGIITHSSQKGAEGGEVVLHVASISARVVTHEVLEELRQKDLITNITFRLETAAQLGLSPGGKDEIRSIGKELEERLAKQKLVAADEAEEPGDGAAEHRKDNSSW